MKHKPQQWPEVKLHQYKIIALVARAWLASQLLCTMVFYSVISKRSPDAVVYDTYESNGCEMIINIGGTHT